MQFDEFAHEREARAAPLAQVRPRGLLPLAAAALHEKIEDMRQKFRGRGCDAPQGLAAAIRPLLAGRRVID